MSGLSGVVMSDHSRVLFEGRFERTTGEFVLVGFTDLGRDHVPLVGDEDDLFQCLFAAELAKHPEIPPDGPGKPTVGDAVDVEEPGKLEIFSISVEGSVEKQRTSMWAYVLFKKGPIFFKISVSVVDELSNPGVSMRVTVLPSRANSSESWTSVVHNSESVATGRFEPLARLMN